MRKINFRRIFLAGASVTAILSGSHPARANDGIFPAAPRAKSAIDFDGRGFLVGGKRTFIASGTLHYSRVPRALWRDRLLKFKRAGINTVETYTFWNIHEPKPGQFDFAGDADLGAFLSLAQSLGMMAIVRVGPYYCAEWDFGGYPVWLRHVPGLEVRVDNEPFKRAVGAFFDRLLPIVAAHQINRGGNVVMVQLENEHPQGWGTEMPNGYFRFLREKALVAGIEVPYFFSGLHHSSDPAGERSWDSKGRQNPWFSTEFWPGWFDLYGALSPANLRRFDRGTWKIIAYGGNGYNYYMLHGGSNFGYTNSNEDAASYDYGAAVGQAGDLRSIYYRFKRAATFATSFASILENSENADAKYRNIALEPKIKVTARQSPSGTLIFLDNPGDTPIQTQISAPDGSKSALVTIEPGELMPVTQDFSLAPGVKIDFAPTRILGISKQGAVTTLVIYGQVGTPAELRFSVAGDLKTNRGDLVKRSGAGWSFQTAFAAKPMEAIFSVGKERVRVLALSPERADRTYFVAANGANYVISGPDFVGDVTLRNNKWQIDTERPWNGARAFPITIYGATWQTLPPAPPFRGDRVTALALSAWQVGGGSEPAQPSFNDAKWMKSVHPTQMGNDNDDSSYAWYRTRINTPTAGKYTLTYSAGNGHLSAFVDGKALSGGAVGNGGLNLDLAAGKHTLAFFTSHSGRDKLFGHLGSIRDVDVKGLSGAAYLAQSRGGAQVLSGWKMLRAGANAANALPPIVDATWSDYKIGADAFGGKTGDIWFAATLPASDSKAGKVLHFGSVDEDATVFLNGAKIGQHAGWNQSFDVELDSGWKTEAPNQLTVLIHNQSYGGGIDQPVSFLAYDYRVPQTDWKLRGGPTEKVSHWKPLSKNSRQETGPQWFRATFVAPISARTRPIWRFKTRGLSRGSVWLNGHNLGRYPEKIPVDGLYLPENWLQKGANSIEIFDEEGQMPSAVAIEAEVAASRDLARVTSR